MGKCRDCIHHDVCKDFIDTTFDGLFDDGDELPYDDNDMNGDDCKFYACKSRFIMPQHGYWTEENWRQRSTMFVCSVCGETAYDRPLGSAKHVGKKICKLRFCPNCGAEMCEKVNYENP